MKKLVLLLVLFACKSAPETKPAAGSAADAAVYYPLAVGNSWTYAQSGAEKREKSFLGELLGVGGIGDATAKEAIDGLFVAAEEFAESFGGAEGEGKHEVLVAQGGID